MTQDWYDYEDFDWAVPAGYELFEARIVGPDPDDYRANEYLVVFGTLPEIVAARSGGTVRFLPSTGEAA